MIWPGSRDAVRAAIGVTGQFSAVDNLLTGEENLLLMADLHHLSRREGPARAADLLERFDLVDAAKKTARHLLRRHAAPARPGDDAGRRPAHHLPRRADHRPGPAQPPHHVADHPRPGGRRRHDLAHHAVPGGGRPARRPDRGARSRASWSPRARPTSSSAASPAGTFCLQFADARGARRGRPHTRARPTRDDEALTLQVPTDGSARVAQGRARPARPRSDREASRRLGAHPRSGRCLLRPHRPRRQARKKGSCTMSTLSYALCAIRRRCCGAMSSTRCATSR